LKDNELCPALNKEQVIETIDKLPDSINPKVDSNWQYRTSFEEINGDYKEVAVGIKPIIKKINRYVIGEFKPSWESEDVKSNSERDHVINVSIEHDETLPKRVKVKSPKMSSSSAIWWVIGVIIFLFLLK
jgi:hypothetical protein